MSYPSGGPTSLGSTDQFASEEYIKLRDAIIASVFFQTSLGGSRSTAIAGIGYQDAIDYIDFVMPDSASTGAVWKAVIDLKCEDASTTITPKIRNITDSSDTVVGSAHSSTSWGSQSLSFTPASGKTYRLMAVKSDDAFSCWCIGVARRSNA